MQFPARLDGAQADIVRDYFSSNLTWRVKSPLLSIFIPKPEVCAPIRKTITDAGDWIANIDAPPQFGDEDYDAFNEDASAVLRSALEAFAELPQGCEMQRAGDDCYECRRCDFEVVVD